MKVEEHIASIKAMIPEGGFAPPAALLHAEAAIKQYPNAPELWCLRGDLIQLTDSVDDGYSLDDALSSYQQAIRIDPTYAEGYEEIGHYYNAVMDDEVRAQPYFDRAATLRAQGIGSR